VKKWLESERKNRAIAMFANPNVTVMHKFCPVTRMKKIFLKISSEIPSH
jgi:hypothetical protein